MRLGASHRLDDLPDRVLHDGVEQSLACREVDVDGRPHDACPASDLRHAAVGIARQRFEGGVEDGGDARSASARRRLGAGASAVVVFFAI